MTGPVRGDTADDAARWWRAYQLAGGDQVDELRGLAAAGDDEASKHLASWLADHDLLGELRTRVASGDDRYALRELARRLIERDLAPALRELLETADAAKQQIILDSVDGASTAWSNAVRVLADFGHRASIMHLARGLKT